MEAGRRGQTLRLTPSGISEGLVQEAELAQVSQAGPRLLPSVGQLAVDAETPETAATTLPLPPPPYLPPSFPGALMPICSSSL